MFGFLIGIVSLAGLIAVLRAGRRGACGGHYHGGWHGGHGHHGWHGRGHHGWHGGGRAGTRGWLRFLFERLDTTPGQEKEIAGAVETFIENARSLRKEGEASRQDVANVLRTESLDENVLGDLFSRHDERLREMQKAFADALGRIHQALDPEQRSKLASLLESGPRGPFSGGPYRGWI